VLAQWPRYLDGWAQLGDRGRDAIERYAAYRVGYHRGLDRLRANGWRGSGFVRWRHESNRGFLRALAGLQREAAAIGETDEAERVADALRAAGADPVVAIGGDEPALRALGLTVVADAHPGEGPLGGIITALEALGERAELVAVLACDLVDPDPAAIRDVVAHA